MKKIVVIMLAIGLSMGLTFTVMSKGSGTRAIDWHAGGKKSKINFAKHKAKGVKCNDCHVKHKNGKRYKKKCGGCHNTKAKAKAIGHKMCKKCHKAKGGPTKCSGCH